MTKKESKDASDLKSLSFRELEHMLETIVTTIEQGSHDELDAMLVDYERGNALIAELEQRLAATKIKITNVTKKQ